jgi:hypothetical protein
LFFQFKNSSKVTEATGAINYDIATGEAEMNAMFNNLKFGSYEDSIELKYSQIVIDISGKKYK